MNVQVKDQLSIIGTNTLFVLPQSSEDSVSQLSVTGALSSSGLTWRDRETLQMINGVDQISELTTNQIEFTVKGETYQVKVMGVGYNFLTINQDIKMAEGRGFRSGDKAVVIIGKNIAQPTSEDKPVVNLGDRLTLKATVNGQSKELTVRVIGVLAEHGSVFGLNADDIIALPFRTYDQFYETKGSCSLVQVYIKDSDDVDRVEEAIETTMGDDYVVVSSQSAMDVMKNVTGTIQAVLGGIAMISLFVAGLGIINTMTVSVNERTREIGTFKAIGARSTDILMMFLSEAVYTGFIGGVVGSALGFVLGKGIGRYIGIPVNSSISLALSVVSFAVVTCVLSGAWPAWRASKLDPVKALRRE